MGQTEDNRMAAEIVIDRMTPDDIPQVCVVDRLCFSQPWSAEAFASELSGVNPCFYYVARDGDGTVCGYMGIWHILDEGHVTNVAVHPDYRRRGIGRMLVSAALEEGRSKGINAFTLEVRVSNEAAQKLYSGFGFAGAGVRKNYYENSEDALIMWCY